MHLEGAQPQTGAVRPRPAAGSGAVRNLCQPPLKVHPPTCFGCDQAKHQQSGAVQQLRLLGRWCTTGATVAAPKPCFCQARRNPEREPGGAETRNHTTVTPLWPHPSVVCLLGLGCAPERSAMTNQFCSPTASCRVGCSAQPLPATPQRPPTQPLLVARWRVVDHQQSGTVHTTVPWCSTGWVGGISLPQPFASSHLLWLGTSIGLFGFHCPSSEMIVLKEGPSCGSSSPFPHSCSKLSNCSCLVVVFPLFEE